MAHYRTTGHHGNSSLSVISGTYVPRIDILADDVPRVQYVPNTHVYSVRVQDTKDTGELQRSEVHWFYNVLDLHRMVSIRADLFRLEQRLQGLYLYS